MKNSRYTVDSRGRYYRHFEIKIETEKYILLQYRRNLIENVVEPPSFKNNTKSHL